MPAIDEYRIGAPIEDAFLLALKRVNEGECERSTIYLVKYDCCGRERQMSVHQIKSRIAKGSVKCPECARRDCNPHSPYGYSRTPKRPSVSFPQPLWAPPPSAMKLPRRWLPR